MKRLAFLFFALLSSTVLFAGSLTLSDKAGNPIPDGMIIDLWGDVNTSQLKFEFDARNTSPNNHVSKMKKLEVSEVAGTFNLFCWDVCYLEDSVKVSTGTVSLVPNQSWTYGATEYYPQGQIGTTVVKYTIFKTNNPNDSNYFEVHYHITPVGEMESPVLFSLITSPNPSSGGEFSLIIPGELIHSELSLELFSVEGKLVRTELIVTKEDRIPLFLTEKGIYFIRISRNGLLKGIARQVITN